MPVDNTTFRSDLVQTKLPMLGEPVLTPGTLEQLKIPDEVALKPENVIPFLASQSVRYNEIVNRPEIKTMAADIPEYRHEDAMEIHMASSLSREEQAAMQGWSHDTMVGLQSGDADFDKLEQEIEAYIEELKKKKPEEAAGASSYYDGTDDFLFMQGIQETLEEKKEWERKLAIAAASGNPEVINSVLGERVASGYMKLLGKLTEQQAKFIDQRDQVMKDLNLDKNISQADALKANLKFGAFQGDMSENMMKINFALNEYQRITQDTARTNTDIAKPLQVMIQNMKA